MLGTNMSLVIRFVANPQKSAEFYSEMLGIKPVEMSPTFALFVFDNIKVGLWSKYTAEPKVDAAPGATEICFMSDNVDATYEQLAKKRVTIAQVPTDMDFGRTFVFLDLDGHRIRIYKLK